MDMFFALIAIMISILVYLLPAFIASQRGHPQTNAIFMLNLFLGWTLLGWVGALVWAATAIKRDQLARVYYDAPPPLPTA
jgi:RsiW-degrading membrane proteinase PrsW (M82 family)